MTGTSPFAGLIALAVLLGLAAVSWTIGFACDRRAGRREQRQGQVRIAPPQKQDNGGQP